jgi:hypothetical protein
MKTQYTPGPWKIERVGAAGFPQIVCRDHAKFDGAVIATEICNGEANAKLIAASPMLLEALKTALQIIEAEPEACGIYKAHTEKIRAAIAAAEGN